MKIEGNKMCYCTIDDIINTILRQNAKAILSNLGERCAHLVDVCALTTLYFGIPVSAQGTIPSGKP